MNSLTTRPGVCVWRRRLQSATLIACWLGAVASARAEDIPAADAESAVTTQASAAATQASATDAPAATGESFTTAPTDTYAQLIARARDGQASQVVEPLRAILAQSPDDPRILADFVTVLQWAHQDREAVEMAKRLPAKHVPAYALKAAARAARDSGQPALAMSWLDQQLAQAPLDDEALASRLLALAQATTPQTALAALATIPQRLASGDRAQSVPIAMTHAQLLKAAGNPFAALQVCEEILAQRPQQREAYVERARIARSMGAFTIALEAIRSQPSWFDTDEQLHIEQDAVAQQIRHGGINREVAAPGSRQVVADRALIDSEWLADATWAYAPDIARSLDPVFTTDTRRTLFDRLVALHQRDSHAEVIALFESMSDTQGGTQAGEVPDYALAAVADSYLSSKQPKRAQHLFERAINGRHTAVTWEWRVSLAYAQSEAEDIDRALITLDDLAFDLHVARLSALDPMRDQGADGWLERLRVIRANFARFAHRYDDSENKLATLADEIPFDQDVRAAQAGLQLERGQPRRSLQTARRLAIDHPDSVWPAVSVVEALIDVGDYSGARGALDAMRTQHGEQFQQSRLEKQLNRKYQGTARFSVANALNEKQDSSPNPARELRMEASIESPLIGDNWRVTGSTLTQISRLEDGNVSRRRNGGGVSYESADFDMSAMLTSDTHLHQTGAQLRANYTPNDAWRLSAQAARDADDVPMRAVRAGIRLDKEGADLEWKPTDRRSFGIGLEQGRFSDGNQRQGSSVSWRERWIDTPVYKLETTTAVSTYAYDRQDVPYFAPARYSTTGIAITGTQLLNRAYDTSWRHRLTVEPTLNQQQGFGSIAGVGIRYEHEWEVDAKWGGRAALEHVRRRR